MVTTEDLIAHWRKAADKLAEQLEWLERGDATMGYGPEETVEAAVKRMRETIAEYDDAISRARGSNA